MQLVEDPQGAKQQGQDSEHQSQDPLARAAGVRHQAGDKLRPFRADQALHLAQDLRLHGPGFPDQPRNGDDDDQQGSQGEDRVIGERGGEPGSVVRFPALVRQLKQSCQVREKRFHARRSKRRTECCQMALSMSPGIFTSLTGPCLTEREARGIVTAAHARPEAGPGEDSLPID